MPSIPRYGARSLRAWPGAAPALCLRRLRPHELLGVTITSPRYQHLTEEAVSRFRAMTGLDVAVLWSHTEPAFAAKLNLDLLVAPRPIVFFDVDLWMLRPFDFSPLATSAGFCAVPDPGAWNPRAFPCVDCEREGWDPGRYFNSGLFACDLAQPGVQRIFAAAREHLAQCHAKIVPAPADWTDQYFLNWAVQQQPGLFQALPFALNFYKKAVDWGSYPHVPREIIGLHAAGIPLEEKLAVLRREEAVFGEPLCEMLLGAGRHYHGRAVA